jgi:hypothetical protein
VEQVGFFCRELSRQRFKVEGDLGMFVMGNISMRVMYGAYDVYAESYAFNDYTVTIV